MGEKLTASTGESIMNIAMQPAPRPVLRIHEPQNRDSKEQKCIYCSGPARHIGQMSLGSEPILALMSQHFPNVVNATQDYIATSQQNREVAFLVASAFALHKTLLYSNPFSELKSLFAGSVIGVIASRSIRMMILEQKPDNEDIHSIEKVAHSRSFLGAMAVASAVATFFSIFDFLLESAPYLAGGIAAHYAISQLQKNAVVSEKIQRKLQPIVSGTTMGLGLISPISKLVAVSAGAAAGAFFEALYLDKALDAQQSVGNE